jgi:hypothetical protein
LDGTLDGLYRVSRQAETYYHYQLHATNPTEATTNFPVVVYEGVNHMQFASGTPPFLVKKSDLKSEVDEVTGHSMMANTINSFMQQHHSASTNMNSDAALASLQSEIDQTGKIVAPLIAALEQEAFIHFKPACNSDYPMPDCPAYPRYPSKQQGTTPQRECVCGTPWVQAVAQDTMAGFEADGVKVVATDAVHSVSDVTPIHLPHLWSNCSSESGCTLNVTTVTQPIYSSLDGLDTGYSYTSASELRVKLKSREAMWTAAGRKDVNFTQTDVLPSLCAEINKKAVQWALDNAGATAKARFAKNGEPLQMGDDIFKGNVGPLWIYNSLKYNEAKDKSSVTVDAPCSHTPINYSIKSAAGYHYCKLLSPGRAMEWLYIDSLRAKAHI